MTTLDMPYAAPPAAAPPAAEPVRRGARRRLLGSRVRAAEVAALDWQLAGACRDEDESLFFGPPFGRERRREKARRIRNAKRVCEGCPVLDACRVYALENREEFGVWGGLSEQERWELTGDRRARRR